MLKGKSRLCQFLSHFTTYFPNVSNVNSNRPRDLKVVVTRRKRKQGRRQEEKGEATRDGEDGR